MWNIFEYFELSGNTLTAKFKLSYNSTISTISTEIQQIQNFEYFRSYIFNTIQLTSLECLEYQFALLKKIIFL